MSLFKKNIQKFPQTGEPTPAETVYWGVGKESYAYASNLWYSLNGRGRDNRYNLRFLATFSFETKRIG